MKPRITALATFAISLALAFVSCRARRTTLPAAVRELTSSTASARRHRCPESAAKGHRETVAVSRRDRRDARRGKITEPFRARRADYRIIVVWEQDGTQLATNSSLSTTVAPGTHFIVSRCRAPGAGTCVRRVG
jgi:hypothetical protein